MTHSALTSLPDQLFVLDRDHDVHEFLDLLLTLGTFGVSTGLLLVGPGINALGTAHRGMALTQFGDMGLECLMVESEAAPSYDGVLPESAIPVNATQIRELYDQVPRILHP